MNEIIFIDHIWCTLGQDKLGKPKQGYPTSAQKNRRTIRTQKNSAEPNYNSFTIVLC